MTDEQLLIWVEAGLERGQKVPEILDTARLIDDLLEMRKIMSLTTGLQRKRYRKGQLQENRLSTLIEGRLEVFLKQYNPETE